MKQLKRKQEITYRWWRSDGKDIKEKHLEALDETAQERIAEMRKEGYTSGELHDNIYMTNNDPKEGIEYNGWWEMTTVTI